MIAKPSPYSLRVHVPSIGWVAPLTLHRRLEAWPRPNVWPSSWPMTSTLAAWLIHALDPPPSPAQPQPGSDGNT